MMPLGRMQLVRDILELVSTEQARADHLERQILHMDSIHMTAPDVPSKGSAPQSQDGTYRPWSRGTTPIMRTLGLIWNSSSWEQHIMKIYRGKCKSTARETGLKENRNRNPTELLWKVLEDRKNKNNRMPHVLRCYRTLNECRLL